ncbi:hypothetical protein, partial [Acinetobacter baumannii]|uniref:hypothetical protein n=1 Tax=Acinetobacter baumannii TaxID=470 RepID=UPI0033946F92
YFVFCEGCDGEAMENYKSFQVLFHFLSMIDAPPKSPQIQASTIVFCILSLSMYFLHRFYTYPTRFLALTIVVFGNLPYLKVTHQALIKA